MRSFKIPMVVVSMALLTGCFPDEEPRGSDQVRAVRTLVVKEAVPARARTFPAVLEPLEITPLAFDVGGRLGGVDLRVGQMVTGGETLLSVEAADASLRLRQAEAALSEAQISAANARAEARRQNLLFARNVVSEAARDIAVTAADQADARVVQAERSLDLLSETLADTALRAPFDGVVNSIDVQAFGSVQPGQPVVTLYEDDGLQATVLVSYDVVETLSLGAAVSVLPSDGISDSIPATITEIARRAPAVSSFPVIVTLDRTRPDLRSGMAVAVMVNTPVPNTEHGIPVPLSSLALDRKVDFEDMPRKAQIFVYIGAPEEGTVKLRSVEIGAVVGEVALIVDGLAPGERVVTAGVPFLHSGQAVRLTDDAAAVLTAEASR